MLNRSKRFCSLLAAVFAFCAGALQSARAQHQPSTPAGPVGGGQVTADALPSVVRVVAQAPNGEPLLAGRGFFVAEGLVAASYHVVRSAPRVSCGPLGSREMYGMDGVAFDEDWDLALFRVKGFQAPPLKLAAGALKVGQTVYVLKGDADAESAFLPALVSAVQPAGYVQFNVALSSVGTGGPVLDSSGLVRAVACLPSDETHNLAIPVSYLASLLHFVDCTLGRGAVRGSDVGPMHWLVGKRVACPPSEILPPPPHERPVDPIMNRSSARIIQGTSIRRIEPVYPPNARAARITGTVLVGLFIDEKGNVTSAWAISGPPMLRDAAVDAARGWRFKPTLVNGRAVKVIGTLTFNFEM